MKNPWDENAIIRHLQILSGKDISYDKVLIKAIIELLDAEITTEKPRILDVGCATGILISRIYKPGFNIIGIDNSSESIKIAKDFIKQFNNVKVVNKSIINYLPTKHDFFDIIIANMVLHTIEDLDAALESSYRLLKGEGILFISLPHPCYWAFYTGINKYEPYNYKISKKYFIDFKITNDQTPFPQKTPYIHRPISMYEESLIKTGFTIKNISSPFPDKEIMKQYKIAWDFPHFLFIISRKKDGYYGIR